MRVLTGGRSLAAYDPAGAVRYLLDGALVDHAHPRCPERAGIPVDVDVTRPAWPCPRCWPAT